MLQRRKGRLFHPAMLRQTSEARPLVQRFSFIATMFSVPVVFGVGLDRNSTHPEFVQRNSTS
jgi:hypothetical protein